MDEIDQMKTYTSFINEIKEANVPAKVMKAIYNALGAATSDGRSTGAIAMNSSLNNKTPKNTKTQKQQTIKCLSIFG